MSNQNNNWESALLSFDDEYIKDSTINANTYIHLGIIMAQRTLMVSALRGSIVEGFAAYAIFVEHIESLCKAAKYLTSKYDENVKIFKESEDFLKITEQSIKTAKLANAKIQYLFEEVFSRSAKTHSLKDRKTKIEETIPDNNDGD